MTRIRRILPVLLVLLGTCPASARASVFSHPEPASITCQYLGRALQDLASEYHEVPVWKSQVAGILGVGVFILTESVSRTGHPGAWTLLFLPGVDRPADSDKACFVAVGDVGIPH